MSEFRRIVTVVPASIKAVKTLRCVVKNFLTANNVKDDNSVYDLELVMAEALINVIEHTYNFDSTKLISCILEMKDDVLEMKIRDFGPKVKLESLKPRDLSKLREGGLGLYLIRALVDEWKYEEVCKGNLLILRRKMF